MAKEKRPTALWPLYFDSERSVKEGRRAPKRLAVKSPKAEEIAQVAEALGLKPVLDKEALHPADGHSRRGRVFVSGEYLKTSVLRKVAEKLKELRTTSAPEAKRG